MSGLQEQVSVLALPALLPIAYAAYAQTPHRGPLGMVQGLPYCRREISNDRTYHEGKRRAGEAGKYHERCDFVRPRAIAYGVFKAEFERVRRAREAALMPFRNTPNISEEVLYCRRVCRAQSTMIVLARMTTEASQAFFSVFISKHLINSDCTDAYKSCIISAEMSSIG